LLIVTHASKNAVEQGIKKPLLYPGAPNTFLLEGVLDNLLDKTGLDDVVIAFDHKMDCSLSKSYLSNLKSLSARRGLRLVVSASSLSMPSQLTATAAFCRGVHAVRSKYVLFFEHDHLFRSSLDWSIVDMAFEGGAKMIRFNRRLNISDWQGEEVVQKCEFSDQICETNAYCNGPFIAHTSYCSDLFGVANSQIPNWNGMFGGFVEGPVMRQMLSDEFNLGAEEFRERYPIYLYGPVGAPPLIDHFGDFPGRRARWTKRIKQWLGLADSAG